MPNTRSNKSTTTTRHQHATTSSTSKRPSAVTSKPAPRKSSDLTPPTVTGMDTNGKQYDDIQQLWTEELGGESADSADRTVKEEKESTDNNGAAAALSNDKKSEWYKKGNAYWADVDATVDGVLGGFAHVSPADIAESRQFLQSVGLNSYEGAVDCGAGIGRVSKGLLCPLFKHVDLIEPDPKYVDTAKTYIQHPSMRHYFVTGLQSHTFTTSYDCIWIQWCIGHLPDDDCVSFLQQCQQALRDSNSVICVKENCVRNVSFVMDRDDSSVTRSDPLFKQLFKQAGLTLVAERQQQEFPTELFPVKMYALR